MTHRIAVLRVPEQLGELVESGDFHRAGAGELFLHVAMAAAAQDAAIRRNHALAVVAGGGFRIDVQREQSGHARHREG